MSTVRTNTLANYLGQVWITLVSVIFVPIYLRYIGIEAYGIIGFFVALQSLFSILDLGLSATLNRELARRSEVSLSADDTRDLVRTLECIYWPTGALIAIVVWTASGLIAEHWLRTVSLSMEQARGALLLLGLATALQWPVSFYTGGLSGLQRQVLLNVLATVFATVRSGGAVCVLWLISPTIEAYLWWQVGMSAVQSLTYAWITWRVLPGGSRAASFSWPQLRQVGRFAIGVTSVTILSFLLTQSDRIILSKLLPLNDFGVYAFAATIAVMLFKLVQPIVAAVYPRYSQLVAAGNTDVLADFYHRTNQLLAALLLPIAAVLAAFATDLLRVWTGDATLAAASGPILALLVIGTALNGLLNLPYALQLAYGWTRLGFWVNMVSVPCVVPAIWIMGSNFGGKGAAAVWLALNLGYLLVSIPLMHRRLLTGDMWRWYLADIGPPFAASALVVVSWRLAVSSVPDGIMGWLSLLVVLTTSMMVSLVVSSYPRRIIHSWLTTFRGSAK